MNVKDDFKIWLLSHRHNQVAPYGICITANTADRTD